MGSQEAHSVVAGQMALQSGGARPCPTGDLEQLALGSFAALKSLKGRSEKG